MYYGGLVSGNQKLNLQDLIAKGTLEREIQSMKVRNLPPHLHYFLEKMMANDREIRYESADELIEDIERTVEGNKNLAFNPQGGGDGDPLEEIDELFGAQSASQESSVRKSKTSSNLRVSRKAVRSRLTKRNRKPKKRR